PSARPCLKFSSKAAVCPSGYVRRFEHLHFASLFAVWTVTSVSCGKIGYDGPNHGDDPLALDGGSAGLAGGRGSGSGWGGSFSGGGWGRGWPGAGGGGGGFFGGRDADPGFDGRAASGDGAA